MDEIDGGRIGSLSRSKPWERKVRQGDLRLVVSGCGLHYQGLLCCHEGHKGREE